ncbi:MAG: enoyl-CoA hydratase/isomerase family protein [Ktedonobacteraceae bacterium]|nr:enoyl-CoA hydratase/isomerase family protein [Ktedonobacteraceae bacterium]
MVLLQSRENGVLTLTLNRPEALNAITTELLQELAGALQAAQDAAVRVVVLTGAGRAFSAGQDLKEFQSRNISFSSHLEHYILVVKRIRNLEKPVVAAVNGAAAGAGMSLALACDLRLAADSASFTTAFSRIALVPDAGMTYFLPRLIGASKAFDLLAFSPRLSAEDALRIGLVDRVFAAAEFQPQVQALAAQLAQGPRSLGLMKRALHRSESATLDEQLAYEASLQDIAGNSQDHAEGLKAFLEKRTPRFTGQ